MALSTAQVNKAIAATGLVVVKLDANTFEFQNSDETTVGAVETTSLSKLSLAQWLEAAEAALLPTPAPEAKEPKTGPSLSSQIQASARKWKGTYKDFIASWEGKATRSLTRRQWRKVHGGGVKEIA